MTARFTPPETAWQIISRSKTELATGVAAGLIIFAGMKYFGAALLILWLLAGGQ